MRAFQIVLGTIAIYTFAVFMVIRAVAPAFDDKCVIGQLSAEQAEVINKMEWKAGGRVGALPGDRIFNRDCSETSRKFFR